MSRFRLNPAWARYGFSVDPNDKQADQKAKLFDIICSYFVMHSVQEFSYMTGAIDIGQVTDDALLWHKKMTELYNTEKTGGSQRASS